MVPKKPSYTISEDYTRDDILKQKKLCALSSKRPHKLAPSMARHNLKPFQALAVESGKLSRDDSAWHSDSETAVASPEMGDLKSDRPLLPHNPALDAQPNVFDFLNPIRAPSTSSDERWYVSKNLDMEQAAALIKETRRYTPNDIRQKLKGHYDLRTAEPRQDNHSRTNRPPIIRPGDARPPARVGTTEQGTARRQG